MLGNALLLALRQIFRNPMRSILTVLGIVIGVAAVITMVTVGNGATQQVRDQIASLGSDSLMIRPGQRLGPGAVCRCAVFQRIGCGSLGDTNRRYQSGSAFAHIHSSRRGKR